MHARDSRLREPDPDRESLEQQVRSLQERLAFYEGFDLLIQDNVTHARELFRRAAQEREAASAATAQARRESGSREAHLRAELELLATELREVSRAVEAISDRVARALGEPVSPNGWSTNSEAPVETRTERPLAVVVHGVPSARTALSLQRFVASLPQVAGVSAREFVGGVLHLDAQVQGRLQAEQFLSWADPRRIEALTERPDVIELALHEPAAIRAGA
ncbi:MAG TPA: hypothetical protein VK356_04495 [Thermomicrobiales bacterium]|nr:hypothetical protein [Thermomicrobiales bacterium]